jgi:hypothetical protein
VEKVFGLSRMQQPNVFLLILLKSVEHPEIGKAQITAHPLFGHFAAKAVSYCQSWLSDFHRIVQDVTLLNSVNGIP